MYTAAALTSTQPKQETSAEAIVPTPALTDQIIDWRRSINVDPVNETDAALEKRFSSSKHVISYAECKMLQGVLAAPDHDKDEWVLPKACQGPHDERREDHKHRVHLQHHDSRPFKLARKLTKSMERVKLASKDIVPELDTKTLHTDDPPESGQVTLKECKEVAIYLGEHFGTLGLLPKACAPILPEAEAQAQAAALAAAVHHPDLAESFAELELEREKWTVLWD